MVSSHNSNLDFSQDITTLVNLLRYRAAKQPSQVAFTFLQDGETESSNLTYQELDRQAWGIAVQLQSMGAAGSRALLLYPPGLEFIAAFFGCLYAKVVAVPAYPPRHNQNLSRLQAIVSDAQAKIALTSTSVLTNVEGRLAQNPELAAMQWLATNNMKSDLASSWQEPEVSSDTIAFLQYTSGSTGTPKGVIVSHGNLLHNLALIYNCFEDTPNSIGVSWLPPYHDMGLIGGVLQPLYVGAPMILMSPVAFLQKPLRWLQAISHYKATTSGGPNFAYDLCVRKIKPEQRASLDLSRWEVAFTGAEPVRAETLERFAYTFAACGFRREAFYPCYGMAEATLIVSGGLKTAPPIICFCQGKALLQNRVVAAGEEENAQALVGCGQTWLDQKIAIIDPELLTPCPDDQVGEIWVSGPSVAHGYWNRPSQTKETFHAYLADTGEGPYLRTGDLGFLQDGELFATGRLKDLIIIQGRNHYPQDIELTIEQCHPALCPTSGAAFSVEIAGQETLVIVQELERSYLRKLNANEVIDAIRRAVAEQHGLQVCTVLLLKTASLPKTSSGKVQRHACRAGFLDGSLDVLASWSANPQNQTNFRHLDTEVESVLEQLKTGKQPGVFWESKNSEQQAGSQQKSYPQEAIQAWLISKVSEQLAVDPDEIDIRQPLANYGLSSLAAVSISGELQEWLELKLSPTLLYNYPTIKVLAQHLAVEPAVSNVEVQSLAPLRQVDGQTETETEAIAIIGLGCRFPGAEDLESFWQLLRDGVDAIKEVPPSRWEINAFYDPTPATVGKMNTRWGGFLKQVDQFDTQFFGISPQEAESMDPQQRLLLEVSWEALENAGQSPEQLAGSSTGVFIGMSSNDYSRLQFSHPIGLDAYSATGNAFSIAANRLSYLLDLRGPSWAVDTACSSSLVAVHQACQSLHQGECQMALVGGVNLILTPQVTITFSQAKMMAADGRCKTFDTKADGYVRGEGCGIVVLKRLSKALKDGDNIHALIKGSAVNQDGRSNGLTAPSGISQQSVIHQALENAGVAPAQISYVEAHGTGTSLGDPIEVNSLKEILMQNRSPDQPCWIGSVKTNIGHLEAAAGIAGLIKVVLSLQQREIPPHLHLNQLNPYIFIEGTPLSIPTERQRWFGGKEQRLAGVSSFGFGGTNAHVVLEEAPATAPVVVEVQRPQHLMTLSAKSEKALRELAKRYEAFLASNSGVSLADVCFTANTGRAHFDHRLAVITESIVQLREQLGAFGFGGTEAKLVSGKVNHRHRSKIAFLFTGQGSQYVGMGRQLYETQPTFRQALDRCGEILCPYLEQPLLSVLFLEPGDNLLINETAYTQPALFALEYALTELWQSWGITPDVIMGYGLGEYVAACVAGVFSLEDGLRLITFRGRLMQALPHNGERIAVLACESQVRALIEPYAQEVSLTAINGSESLVISGQRQAIGAVCAILEAEGIKIKPLQVSHAFHSPLIEPILTAFEQVAKEVTYSSPQIRLISNATGEPATAEIATSEYWCRHVQQPVRFAVSIETLHQQGYEVFVEIGPKPTLLGMGRQCLPQGVGVWLPSLLTLDADWQQMLENLAQLYVWGLPVDWLSFDRDYPRRRVVLPTYPFQRQHYWVETTKNEHLQARSSSSKITQTPIVNLLQQGDTEQLAQLLGKVGKFSEEQRKFVPELLEVLMKQHQREIATASIQDWLYEVEWQPQPRDLKTDRARTLAEEPGTWIILADQGGVGQALAERLQKQRQICLLVYAGDTYQSKGIRAWSLNPTNPASFERLFQEVVGTSQWPLRAVIHLWGLEGGLTDELTISALEQAQSWSCSSLLHLVQTLVKHEGSVSPRLWLVTRGAMPVGSSLPAVVQAPLWGLGRVISLEHSQIWGGMLDLAPEATVDEVGLLLAEIEDSEGEDHLAFRQGQRYVARLVPSQPRESRGVSFRTDGSYLITGGLGSLGLQIAQWMVEQGVQYLVLAGRREASSQAQQAISYMERMGAKVTVAQTDVSIQEDVVHLLERIQASMPPLQGIIHAAGVLDDGILVQQDSERFARVMAPKVKGTWNLHTLTKTMSLEFFVCFSSIASLLGSPGQGNYAAANAFMDALVHYRHALGLPGMSINWGPWADIGMVVGLDSPYQVRMAAQGLSPLAPEQGLLVLEHLLGQTSPQFGVLLIDRLVLQQQLNAGRQVPLLSKLIARAGAQDETEQTLVQQYELLLKLKKVSPHDRRSLLITHLQHEVANILGLQLSELPDPQQGFFDMGFDSLMTLEFKNRLDASFGCSLPQTIAFESPTINDLADYLVEEVLEWKPSTIDNTELHESSNKQDLVLSAIEQLPDDEVEASIVTRLEKLQRLLKED